MKRPETLSIKSEPPYKLHATSKADAEYFFGQVARRTFRCRKLGIPISNYRREHKEIVSRLNQDGYVILKNYFPKDLINHLRNQVENIVQTRVGLSPIRAHSQETSEELKEGTYHYFPNQFSQDDSGSLEALVSSVGVKEPLVSLKDISTVVFDQGILGMATAFYGAVPLVTFLKVRHAFGNTLAPADTQLFHVDGGSFKIFKVLLYLHDVHVGGGPFCYVRGSHQKKWNGWEQKARYTDSEIEDVYGNEAIIRCHAQAGDVIVADTTGIHRGEKPVNANRSILIVNYCIHPEYGFEHPHILIKKQDRDALSPFGQLAAEHLVEVG
ncbi:MAG: phytanoyl-CoA dioxygenase family protein [Nitrospira sp.]|nr:phytanoyl-CoA dioxygenase family protein [Nitrospira sp.]